MIEWLRIARRRDIVTRSIKVAMIVGTILIAINYGDRLIIGAILPNEWMKMMLTFCVPYCVSTYASVSAVLSAK
ncbi:MAG: nitrate/nitrite transporter NrtS [Gammaproteobacteria bacterium]|nr:nitrate/nitrite transporter NrtS [Gammaproteobacteria bacterium]MCZ6772214.1 nitrate/nitrite transporter NrtS [Pseudomonadota bacterium]MCZ6895029.1 nitrate/nitrite transporter NrtS [Gammaproteobacteria bacterium]